MTRTKITSGLLAFAACTFAGLHAQTPPPDPLEQVQTTTMTKTPLAFEVVSVKPAAPGTFPIVPAFMRDKGARILGVQRMAAPLSMLISYAYHMQMSESSAAFRKQPDWVRNRIYTVIFRAEGEPTRDQVREMMRTMLADRFDLQIYEYTREGTVNKLVLSKPGVLGPNIKPHPRGASCSTQEDTSVGKAPEASTPSAAHCGFTWYYLPGMVLHVGITTRPSPEQPRRWQGSVPTGWRHAPSWTPQD
jgi:uncharacterized protein (TIGR03435 family)